MSNLTKYPVLVTGSNGGIGSGLAAALLDAGFDVACHYHNERTQIETALLKRGQDVERATFSADLTREEQVTAMHEAFYERFGTMFAIINVAGASSNAMSWRLTLDEVRRIIDANLISTFLCSRAYAPEMRAVGLGRIINVSSVVGENGVAGASHYCAAKAGIIGLTKAMALELAPKNITVNALSLGYFAAGLINEVPEEIQAELISRIPLRRFGRVSEIVSLVLYLLSLDAAYATGQVFRLNGGI
jgi:3-oxoacyl-[acyl-carrier protein] reductase